MISAHAGPTTPTHLVVGSFKLDNPDLLIRHGDPPWDVSNGSSHNSYTLHLA